MVIPFALMATMSTTSEGDFRDFRLIPEYWFNKNALFRKVAVDAARLDASATWIGRDDWFSPTDVRPEHFETLSSKDPSKLAQLSKDFEEFWNSSLDKRFKIPLFIPNPDSPFSARDSYREFLRNKYGTIQAVNQAHGDSALTWQEFEMPQEVMNRLPDQSQRVKDYREWVESLAAGKATVYDANGDVNAFLKTILVPADARLPSDSDGKVINSQVTYDDLMSSIFTKEQQRQFFTERAALRFTRVDPTLAQDQWLAFLEKAREGERPLSPTMPKSLSEASTWARFVQMDAPIEALSQDRPETAWREFLLTKYGSWERAGEAHGKTYQDPADVQIPRLEILYHEFKKNEAATRYAYFSHNFKTVIAFITVHGSALLNTIIFILLTIVGALTVNPMAAYALSRFRLKESHQILVFLLATMAFPGEVLMIPGFLQIKEFPLASVLATFVVVLLFFLVSNAFKQIPIVLRSTAALVVVGVTVFFVAPEILKGLGIVPNVSLMNSFWALVLPGLASGYGIFLLKGFFDSLPPELYEAGLMDGASEWKMFYAITLPMCKPILAVMALGSFTAAYGAFMHAFLVTQDPRMWTLMVFLYEFQQSRSLPMVMASLVIAAIPTLIVFLLAQRVILRGIVIPTYK